MGIKEHGHQGDSPLRAPLLCSLSSLVGGVPNTSSSFGRPWPRSDSSSRLEYCAMAPAKVSVPDSGETFEWSWMLRPQGCRQAKPTLPSMQYLHLPFLVHNFRRTAQSWHLDLMC